MQDARIEAKEDKFVETFQGKSLYFVVEEVFDDTITNPEYELLFVTTRIEDYQEMIDDLGEDVENVFHLFKSSIFGQTIEWVESYDGFAKMCDVPLDLDETSWAILAKLSLQKNKLVNEVLVDALKEYIKNEK